MLHEWWSAVVLVFPSVFVCFVFSKCFCLLPTLRFVVWTTVFPLNWCPSVVQSLVCGLLFESTAVGSLPWVAGFDIQCPCTWQYRLQCRHRLCFHWGQYWLCLILQFWWKCVWVQPSRVRIDSVECNSLWSKCLFCPSLVPWIWWIPYVSWTFSSPAGSSSHSLFSEGQSTSNPAVSSILQLFSINSLFLNSGY